MIPDGHVGGKLGFRPVAFGELMGAYKTILGHILDAVQSNDWTFNCIILASRVITGRAFSHRE